MSDYKNGQYLSYAHIREMIRNSPLASLDRNTILIGIQRAGVTVALIAKEEFGFTVIDNENFYHCMPELDYVLVDDVVGTGHTLKKNLTLMKDRGVRKVTTFALVQDANRCKFSADSYCVKTDKWLVFPWDAEEYKQGKHVKYDFSGNIVYTAYDLDGTLCSGLDTKLDKFMLKYIPFLWANFRHIFVCATPLGKSLRGKRVIIITGRPETDTLATQLWLKWHGIDPVLYMNKGDLKSIPYFKANVIIERDIRIYYENEPAVVEILRNLTSAEIIQV